VVGGMEFEGGLAGDDGLDEQDERVDCVPKPVQDKQLGKVRISLLNEGRLRKAYTFQWYPVKPIYGCKVSKRAS